MWRGAAPESWAGLLARLACWAEARMVGAVEVEPPEAVKSGVEEEVRYPYTKRPVRLRVP